MKDTTVHPIRFKKLRRFAKILQSVKRHKKKYIKALNGICEIVIHKFNQQI